ncbi:dihydroorotate dehydrogenase electron transfer subunit [Candidatus Woesearchaeota archaeon]|nr:dihydroorotate dehydrogenase electron transfer subunit [Candidatus Woesearchaeota archaeon]
MCEDKQENPIVLDVAEVVDEGKDLKTFRFDIELNASPGQFIMLWLPGVNLKPFSISYQDQKSFGVTVSGIGEFTNKLMKVKKGDKLGIQGPYGTSFSEKGKNVCLVGGGCGSAPMAFLAEELMKKGKNVSFIIGANTKQGLMFLNRFKGKKMKLIACTDDGSFGYKGFATQALEKELEKKKFDIVYTCGPEIMMAKVVEIAEKNKICCEVSMERYMKCGFGICGQCVVDPLGIRICKEGSVLDKQTVKKITEFNKYKRGPCGKKQKFSYC